MPHYKIEYPIRRNGDRLKSGGIELSAEEAAPLLACGALSCATDDPDTPTAAAGPGDGDPSPGVPEQDEHTDDGLSESQHTLRAYLADLKADGHGKPKVAEAREATAIEDLSAAELAAAWKALG